MFITILHVTPMASHHIREAYVIFVFYLPYTVKLFSLGNGLGKGFLQIAL